ncbi:PDZ domain-containing protein [Cloacibacillus sp.]|uniref:PDZ domain-containing protein n=1 Tax=Cloacibacillus sp. TaxID=2049023 RepID=UPI0025BE3AEC|nr:PDZ domain-containing protein [Cloacibacillus sp.]MCC8057361.1 PDZ domain-containing protein [Cloacibacillus sp.]
MKKIMMAILFVILTASVSFAASVYTTTIRDCTPQQVQDVLIEVMTGKNFAINEVTPYKLTFDKNFGDGFWTAAQNTTVRFNLLPRDGNIKMMVTETEKISNGWGGFYERKRSIDQLVPIIKEVKNLIDHTPKDQIGNEAVDQLPGSGNEREKKLGLTLTDKDMQGCYRAKTVDPGSAAANAKIVINDKILEINGQDLSTLELEAINTYIANKWASGSSLIILIEHDGEKKIVTLKKDTQ